jgi:hypothetical protein
MCSTGGTHASSSVVGTDCLGSRAAGCHDADVVTLLSRRAPVLEGGNGFRPSEDEATVPHVEPMTSTSPIWNSLPRQPTNGSLRGVDRVSNTT